MPTGLSPNQIQAILARLRGAKKPTNQWQYFPPPSIQRRRRAKQKTAAPKTCAYCGGKIGQGFEQITIPRMIQIRICAPCRLKMYNWIHEQMEKENGDKAAEHKG